MTHKYTLCRGYLEKFVLYLIGKADADSYKSKSAVEISFKEYVLESFKQFNQQQDKGEGK